MYLLYIVKIYIHAYCLLIFLNMATSCAFWESTEMKYLYAFWLAKHARACSKDILKHHIHIFYEVEKSMMDIFNSLYEDNYVLLNTLLHK